MRLTTRSRYGTRMVLDIALHGKDQPVRIGDIADRQGVSVKYLEKLIRELKRAGYIKSKRGPRGGHMLTRPPEDISVGEIVSVLEGETLLVDCDKDATGCPRQAVCLTRSIWKEASEAMYKKLNSFTFGDLVRDTALCPDSAHMRD